MKRYVLRDQGGETTYDIPTSWAEVTLKQLRDSQLVKPGLAGGLARLAILTGIPEGKLARMPLQMGKDLAEDLAWAASPPEALQQVATFTADGTDFWYPNPLVERFSFGQYIDTQIHLENAKEALGPEATPERLVWHNIHHILATMVLPVGVEEYDSAKALEYAPKLLKMDGVTASTLAGFFLRIAEIRLASSLLAELSGKLVGEAMSTLAESRRTTRGITRLRLWLTEMFLKYPKSRNSTHAS